MLTLRALAATIALMIMSAAIAAPRADVIVDATPLRERGAGILGEVLAAQVAADARVALGGRLPAGTRLVIRLDSVQMSGFPGDSGGGPNSRGGGGSSDYVSGELLITDGRGEVLARHPQLLALPSSSGGAWYAPENEQRRVAALARAYAAWAVRWAMAQAR
jgi:hypothetical protein